MDFTVLRTRDQIYIDLSSAYTYTSEKNFSPTSAYNQTDPLRIPLSQWQALMGSVRSVLDVRRGVLGPLEDPDGNLTGYDFVEGVGIPRPEDSVSVFEAPPLKVNNSPFAQKVKDGKIVVSPYRSKVNVEVKLRSGRITDSGSPVGAYPFGVNLANPVGFSIVGDRWYFNARTFIFPKRCFPFRVKMERSKTRWITPQFYTAKELYRVVSQKETLGPDVGLVTNTWADNNRLRLDFLTSLAEAPKTLSSILDKMGGLGRCIVDLKKRRVFLTKGHQRTTEKFGMSHNQARARIIADFQFRISEARTPHYRAVLGNRMRKRLTGLEKSYRRELVKANREYATSIASIWLQWRYEILPLAYTANDALDVIADLHSQYITSRGRLQREVAITTQPGWGLSDPVLKIPFLQRVMIKSKLSPADNYGKTLSTNPFTTAWELLTLSFVVDWFINIGDVIAGFTGGYSSTSGSTSSNLFDFSNTVRSSVSPDAFVSYSIKFYTREVIDPRLCGGLVISPDLNLQRNLDAMALIWGRSKYKILR